MFLKFKNDFKSLVWEHGLIKDTFQSKYILFSLLYFYINLLGVNGVRTAAAKEKNNIINKRMEDILRR